LAHALGILLASVCDALVGDFRNELEETEDVLLVAAQVKLIGLISHFVIVEGSDLSIAREARTKPYQRTGLYLLRVERISNAHTK
jgi:hypothetical protein